MSLVEAVDLVDKKNRLFAVHADPLLRFFYDFFHILFAGCRGIQLGKLCACRVGDDAGKRRFSRSRRAVENDGAEFIRLDRTVQQLSRADDVLLSNHLVQRCRAHARCEGGLFFHCGFFHIIKQIHVFFTPFFFLPFILSHFGGYPQPLNLGFSATMFDGIRGSYSSISSRTVTNVYPSSFNSFKIRRSASTVAR